MVERLKDSWSPPKAPVTKTIERNGVPQKYQEINNSGICTLKDGTTFKIEGIVNIAMHRQGFPDVNLVAAFDEKKNILVYGVDEDDLENTRKILPNPDMDNDGNPIKRYFSLSPQANNAITEINNIDRAPNEHTGPLAPAF